MKTTQGNIYLISAVNNSALRAFCPFSYLNSTLSGYSQIKKYPVSLLPLSLKRISKAVIWTINQDHDLPSLVLKEIKRRILLYTNKIVKDIIIVSNSIVVYKAIEKLLFEGEVEPSKVFLCKYQGKQQITEHGELTFTHPAAGQSILPDHLHREFELLKQLYNYSIVSKAVEEEYDKLTITIAKTSPNHKQPVQLFGMVEQSAFSNPEYRVEYWLGTAQKPLAKYISTEDFLRYIKSNPIFLRRGKIKAGPASVMLYSHPINPQWGNSQGGFAVLGPKFAPVNHVADSRFPLYLKLGKKKITLEFILGKTNLE